MRRKANTNQAEAPGQDSFLDVVANLVGIIIILIMVVGAGTSKAFVAEARSAADAEDSAEQGSVPDDEQLEAAAAAATAVEADMYNVAQRIRREELEVSLRRAERDRLLTILNVAERGMDERRQKLTAEQSQQIDLQQQLAAARQQLQDLERTRLAVERSGPPPGVIEHLPTPMARTVFGHEYHFRLSGGRLVYIPWDELVERLKADAPKKVERLRDRPLLTETLGPVDGFWMKYTIKRVERQVQAGGSTSVQQRAEFDRFVMIPTQEDLGETVAQALRPQSDFRDRIDRLDPARSTITIWVYPDSFHQFRDLKKMLFERGFLAAARPLPEGHPIGASQDGSRSSAQ